MLQYKVKKATRRRDERGFLLDFLKREEVDKKDRVLGQIYLVTFEKKNVIRGNHYHSNKREWFVAVKGRVRVILENINTKERKDFILDGDSDEYERIFVDKNIAHAFTNLTKHAILVNYCNKPYHNDNPDTLFYKIL